MAARDKRLTRRADFRRLTKGGKAWANRLLILKTMPNSLAVSRYGFSVGKSVGNAVSRNRVKRRLREIARQRRVKPGWDVLVIARTPITGASFVEIEKVVTRLLSQAGLLGTSSEEVSTRID